MNQYGFVEITHIKNDKLYRAALPMGVPWSEVHEVLIVMASEVAEHIKVIEEQQRLEKEQPNPSAVLDADIIPQSE